MAFKRLQLGEVVIDAGTQVRVRLDPDVIDEYAQGINNGAAFPPITVFAEKGSERFYLADGFHRLAAAKQVGMDEIGAEILVGDNQAAIRHALDANAKHGLRRTQADKRHAVMMAFENPEFDELSARQVGELCNVSRELVRRIRNELNEAAVKKAQAKGKKGKGDDVIPTADPPTQGEIDLDELRLALKLIRGFPYSGKEAKGKLVIDPDVEKEIRIVYEWLGEALASV